MHGVAPRLSRVDVDASRQYRRSGASLSADSFEGPSDEVGDRLGRPCFRAPPRVLDEGVEVVIGKIGEGDDPVPQEPLIREARPDRHAPERRDLSLGEPNGDRVGLISTLATTGAAPLSSLIGEPRSGAG